MLFEEGRAFGVVFWDRLRIDATEQRVVLSIQRGHLAGRAREQFGETAGADSKQRIMRETTLVTSRPAS